MTLDDMTDAKLGWCLDEAPPFRFSISVDVPSNTTILEKKTSYRRSRAYVNIRVQLLKHIDCATIMATDLPILL